MPLVLRSEKGSQLTFNEMDGNLTYLEGLSQDKLSTGSFNSATGSFATTGSNRFIGNQTITGSFTAISGSGDLTSSVRFIHNTIAADQGSSVFEVRHRNNTYSENIALKLFADDITAKMQYEKDGSTVDVLQMGLNNNELFLLQDTRVGFTAGTHKLMVTGSLLVSGSTNINGFTVLPQISASLNFVNDTAAASGGVPLGGLYRSGSFIQIRLV
jgi:hypothetical protein